MSLLMLLVKPLAYVSLPVIILHTAAKASPLVRYYVRLGLYLSALGICSAWGAIASIGMTIIGRRFDINWLVARSFYALAGRLLDIRFEVEGEEYLSTRPAILVGNHQSMVDILYLGRILPQQGSIMAKKELQWTPLLGQFMTLSGAVFIDRKNNARAFESLAAAGNTIKARRTSLWVFPEGTRTNRPESDLLPFKKGAFHLAVQANVPITPVVCQNYWHLYRPGVFGSGTLKIKILPPVSTDGLSGADVTQLAVSVREQMLVALHEISGTQPEKPTPTTAEVQFTPESASNPPSADPGSDSPERIEIRQLKKEGTDVLPLSINTNAVVAGSSHKQEGSDRGPETEEDDGMVLVDRPPSSS